jgi:hypothetical protein
VCRAVNSMLRAGNIVASILRRWSFRVIGAVSSKFTFTGIGVPLATTGLMP